ncbi:hypothetical protein ANN_06671 [Periplaneta americana]|uniref:Uncharacterized protein n=1 Tax=Periplaneta americana TaxID=6978 RepID=A0ABQ8TFZ7_PERAM|nr:hypothetical protein ANN_06671 [Periplaneta americana]
MGILTNILPMSTDCIVFITVTIKAVMSKQTGCSTSLMLAGNEFQSLGRAIVKEDEYEEVRWDGIVSIVSWRERVFRLWWEESVEECLESIKEPAVGSEEMERNRRVLKEKIRGLVSRSSGNDISSDNIHENSKASTTRSSSDRHGMRKEATSSDRVKPMTSSEEEISTRSRNLQTRQNSCNQHFEAIPRRVHCNYKLRAVFIDILSSGLRPHIDVSLTGEHDPKLQEYFVCPQNMPQFDSEGIPNQAPETNKPMILNGPTSRNREGSDQVSVEAMQLGHLYLSIDQETFDPSTGEPYD